MALTMYPMQDYYETTLSQARTGGVGSVYVNATPLFTFPWGTTCEVIVSPGTSIMQGFICDSYNSTTKTLNASSVTVDKWEWLAYTASTHPIGSIVRISMTFGFIQAFIDELNTKTTASATATTVQSWSLVYAVDAWGTDAYVITLSPALAAYTAGMEIHFKANTANTGACTINVNGLWVKNIIDKNGNNLPDGTIAASGLYTLLYNWTSFVFESAYQVASDAEATAGTETSKFITPKQVKDNYFTMQMNYWYGTDWNVTINSGTTTLTRDMYYNNLTVTSPWVLDTAGYRVFVRGTFSGTGTINRNGNNWGNGAAWGTGTAGVAATTLWQWSLNAEIASGAWGTASGWVGGAWVAGTASTTSLSNVSSVAGWAGWDWGTNIWWIGWVGAASTRGAQYNQGYNIVQFLHPATAQGTFTVANYKGKASSWWGGAGWDFIWQIAGWWWGWGGNGWLIWIASYIWSFTGTVTATGGTGWNGWSISVWSAWGWGGGWWGNWGTLLRIYNTIPNDCTKILTGWAWGTGGTGLNNWTNWTTGAIGETISIVI